MNQFSNFSKQKKKILSPLRFSKVLSKSIWSISNIIQFQDEEAWKAFISTAELWKIYSKPWKNFIRYDGKRIIFSLVHATISV